MRHTQSATELTPVLVEPIGGGASVWLRKDITTVEVDIGDGLSQTMWEADEVFGHLSWVPTVAEVAEGFDELWEALEQAGKTDRELVLEALAAAERAQAQADFTAIMTDTMIDPEVM